MKSGLSAGIFAIQAIQKLGYKPIKNVILESVVGEETGGCGTLTTIVNGYTADAAVILEPTDFKICPIQAGALTFRLKISGKSIHACMKNKGVSAIEKFMLIFNAVSEYEKERHLAYKNPYYEDPSNIAPINFGKIFSGDWPSTVPNELIAEGRLGVFPGETVDNAKQSFEEVIKHAAEKDDWLNTHPPFIEWFEGQFEPGETSLEDPIISELFSTHENYFGSKPKIVGVTYGSDLRLFTNYGRISSVLYGPGDVINAHVVDECISLEDIFHVTNVIVNLIIKWCGVVKNE